MQTNISSESTLRTVSEVFVTFLYAASVNMIMAQFAQPEGMAVWKSVVVLLFILFLFSDWVGRVRLPWLLPPDDQVGVSKQLLKTALEVAGLFFLVMAWLVIIEIIRPQSAPPVVEIFPTRTPAQQPSQDLWSLNTWTAVWWGHLNIYKAFASFLIATFLWNLLMLRVMQQIRWWDLVAMSFKGDALDAGEGRRYAQRFWEFRDKLEAKVEAKRKRGEFILSMSVVFIESCVRTGAQLVAIHIAFANLLAALVILISDIAFGIRPAFIEIAEILEKIHSSYISLTLLGIASFLILLFIFRGWKPNWKYYLFYSAASLVLIGAIWSQYIFTFVFLLGVPTIIFLLASQFEGKDEKIGRGIGGSIGVILLLLLYLMVEPKMLIIIVAVQQVLINAFLQYAASGNQSVANKAYPGAYPGCCL